MADTKPIPVRLPTALLPRIDAVAKRLGYNRARLIAFCITTFLEDFERRGMSMMPLDWEEILKRLDGRTKEGRSVVIEQSPNRTLIRQAKDDEQPGVKKVSTPSKLPGGANSKKASAVAEASMDDAAEAAGLTPKPERSPEADAPTSRKRKPATGAGAASK
jgi:hypothetical protein